MNKIRILYVFGFPISLGGHFKSALALAKNLISMGYKVYIMSPGGAEEMINEFLYIGAKYFPLTKITKNYRIPRPLGALKIIRICKEHSIDLIHAQDFKSLSSSYLAAIILKSGFVFTRAGGPVNENFPPSRIKSIFYSQELKDGMTKRYGLISKNIILIRARIDMNIYKCSKVNKEFLNKYDLPSFGTRIVMATRLNHVKLPWLNTLFKFAEQISSEKNGIKIIIAGDGPLFSNLKEHATKINQKSKGGLIIHMIGPVLRSDEMNQLYNYADIIVGNGRGILEAMACRKPAILLGENGEGELVNESNVDEIARFNFSGRNFRKKECRSGELQNLLKNLIENKEELERASSFSFEYIKNHMDASIGANQLTEAYQQALSKKNSFLDYLSWYAKVIKNYLQAAIKKRFLSH